VGILDALQGLSANPAAQQGLLAAGLGMLSANHGGNNLGQIVGQGGLLGMNAYSSANEEAIKTAMARQQMQQVDAETQMKQQQLAQAQRQFNMQQGILEQTGFLPPGTSAASGGMGGSGGAGMPGMLSAPAAPADPSALGGAMAGAGQGTDAAPMQPAQGTPQQPGMGGMQQQAQQAQGRGVFAGLDDNQRAQAALSMVGMKDVASVIAPDFETLPNGIQINKKTGQPTGRTFPVSDSQGHAIQMVANQNGGFDVAIPNGSLQAFTGFQNAQEAAKAGFDLEKNSDQNGNTYWTSRANILQNLNGAQPGLGGGNGGGQGGMGRSMGGQPGAGGSGSPMLAGLSPARQEYLNATAKQDATDMHALDSAADAAPTQMAQYSQLKNAINQFNAQGDTTSLQALQERLKGIIPGYQGGSSMQWGQVIQNLGSQMTADMRSNLGMTRMTDSDLKYLNGLVAGAGTNPTAAGQIIDARMAMLQRQQMVRQMASKWEANYGQLSARDANGQRFQDKLQDWNNQYTLQSQIKAMQQPQQQGQ
jgi:hypothetical protein